MATKYFDRDKVDASDNRLSAAAGSYWPAPHHGMVSEYQQSGIPFAASKAVANSAMGTSGGLLEVNFPYVTRWVIVNVHNGTGTSINECRVGFGNYDADEGIQGSNYVDITTVRGLRLEVKCKKMFFLVKDGADTTVDVMAGLTNIKNDTFPAIAEERYFSGLSSITVDGSGITHTVFTLTDLGS